MKIFRSFEEASVIINPVVTTGSFDGVHIGHKTILKRLQLLAEKHSGESVLITFHPHPRQVLYPDTSGKNLKLINSQVEKLELLRKAGLNNVIIIEFTKEFSKITSDQFVKDYIHGILKAKVVVVGFNHHFGFNKEGDFRQLLQSGEKYNFETEEIPEQEVQNETVSSTKIRQAIGEGYIQRANAWLDHYYILMGIPEEHYLNYAKDPVVFFKVPLTEESKLLPAPGIYAVSAELDSGLTKGMVVINRDPYGEEEVLIHLLENANFKTRLMTTLFFHKKISGSIDLTDKNKSHYRLQSAIAEISELIY
jgi:riboflavin kinase / FMN adenylyltransferase